MASSVPSSVPDARRRIGGGGGGDAPMDATNASTSRDVAAGLKQSVDALTRALGLDPEHRFTESLAAASTTMLGKMLSTYDVTKVAITQARRVLSERAEDPEAFAKEYEALKQLRVEELDRYLAVVAKIASDEDLAFAVSEAGARVAAAEIEASRLGTVARGRAGESESTGGASSPGGLGTPERYNIRAGGRMSPTPSSSRSMDGLGGDFRRMTVDAATSAPIRSSGLFGKAERTVLPQPFDLSGPKLPDWNYKRPFLTGAHLGSGTEQERNIKALNDYGTAEQELLVLDDLLYAMMGVDGRYISAWKGTGDDLASTSIGKDSRITRVKFEVELGLEAPLSALVKNMLPLCSDAATIRAFIESRHEFKHGYVSHALAADMRELLNDWHTLVVQLEHQRNIGALSLQSAWFYCQPAAPALRLMASIASRAYHLKGATILNLLHREGCDHAGDAAVSSLLQRLSKATASPYIRAVELWVYDGQVDDPYDEFLIVEQAETKKESLTNDYESSYWMKRYSLRDEIPHFIGEQLAQKILTTGRYLNAVRETKVSAIAELPHRPDEGLGKITFGPNAIVGTGKYADRIAERFEHAAQRLLRIVREEGELSSRLDSMKAYFLLARGDYLVHFLDTAGAELSKSTGDIRSSKLQSLLHLAVKSSSMSGDLHGDDLLCNVDDHGILHHLSSTDQPHALDSISAMNDDSITGLDTFVLDFDTPWPASIILHRRALSKYQILFRHLFQYKCAEREMCNTWQTLKSMRGETLSRMFIKSHVLTQRMLNFLQSYLCYVTNEVIDPHWNKMNARLESARTVDQIIESHDSFLETSMRDSLLFWPKILKRLDRLRAACLRFARDSQRFAASATRAIEEFKETSDPVRLRALDEEVHAIMSDAESQYEHLLRDLLSAMKDSGSVETNLSALCSRLDFNGYFATRRNDSVEA
jgi:gamma-tubulin complex component 2